VRRRTFIAGLAGAAAWPLAARAQQSERMRRMGVLTSSDENDPVQKAYFSAFTQALADLGWTDGRNMRIDVRGSREDRRERLSAKWVPFPVAERLNDPGSPLSKMSV
jgi:putative ABC transport system substrate-binding protein